jgi:glucan phosphoethanolaminetransferase (alkaline phosphatase superfamily)
LEHNLRRYTARANTGKMLLLIVSLHIGYRWHRKTCNNSLVMMWKYLAGSFLNLYNFCLWSWHCKSSELIFNSSVACLFFFFFFSLFLVSDSSVACLPPASCLFLISGAWHTTMFCRTLKISGKSFVMRSWNPFSLGKTELGSKISLGCCQAILWSLVDNSLKVLIFSIKISIVIHHCDLILAFYI